MNTQNKASWENKIRGICVNYKKDSVNSFESFSLTEEQFTKLFEYIKKNFIAKGKLKKTIAELILKSQMENEIKFGDGWGKQEPNYKLIVDKLLKSLE